MSIGTGYSDNSAGLMRELTLRDSSSPSSEMVLGRLNKLVKEFVYRSSINHGLSDAKAREA